MGEIGSVLYLQNDKFGFYTPLLGKVIEFRFVPEIVQDLEVVNPDLLSSLIQLFVESNKIPKGELVIVISDSACIVKDIIMPQAAPGVKQEDITEQVQKIIDSVPFEEVSSKTFPQQSGTKIWATNKALFSSIAGAFEKLGFKINSVLPGLVFAGDISAKPALDIAGGAYILRSVDSVRAHNLFNQKAETPVFIEEKKEVEKPEGIVTDADIEEEPPKKKSNKRLFAMIGIFVVLIIILVFVYMSSLSQGV